MYYCHLKSELIVYLSKISAQSVDELLNQVARFDPNKDTEYEYIHTKAHVRPHTLSYSFI